MRLRRLFIIPLLAVFTLSGVLNLATVSALSGSDWQAGRIMDDSVFFDKGSMNADQIQAFLNSKVPTCDTNGTQPYQGTTAAAYGTAHGNPPPYTCLKDYQALTPDTSTDVTIGCNTIPAATRTAAQMINDVAKACGINPQLLLVMLEVQQGLVTDTWPWPGQYQAAMGFGCPDNTACNGQTTGLFNQLYSAAKQLRLYTAPLSLYRYQANTDATVQYNPNASCGSSVVHIQNQATAALYNYTPYQPNAAALANLGSAGDNCSAYGNLTLWRLFNTWFGSTLDPVPSADLTVNGSHAATVDYGSQVAISYTSSNVLDCTFEPGDTHGTAGQWQSDLLTANTTYSLSCTGPYGPASASASVTVRPPTFDYLLNTISYYKTMLKKKAGAAAPLDLTKDSVKEAQSDYKHHKLPQTKKDLIKAAQRFNTLAQKHYITPADATRFTQATTDLENSW